MNFVMFCASKFNGVTSYNSVTHHDVKDWQNVCQLVPCRSRPLRWFDQLACSVNHNK